VQAIRPRQQPLQPGRLDHAATIAAAAAVAAIVASLTACLGPSTAAERAARADRDAFGARYRPDEARPALPPLSATSSLAALIRHAVLSDPEVEGAYYGWSSAVESITVARSLPDPVLGFEADIARMVEGLLPALMVALPWPGKLTAAGDGAAALAARRRAELDEAVLGAALGLKSAYYRLGAVDAAIAVQESNGQLLADLAEVARRQSAAGRVTLQDVLRIDIEKDRLATSLLNLRDSRTALLAEWKAALGIAPAEPDPPAPARCEPSSDPPPLDEVAAAALARSPRLAALAADIRGAEASLALARPGRWPDFGFGLESDLKASPVLWTPSISVTLPIWLDKLDAGIAGADAAVRAARARRSKGEQALAAEVARALYTYRASVRDQALYVDQLLPKARQSLDLARAGYVTGSAGFLDLIGAQRQLLDFELGLVEARAARELAIAALSYLVAAPPEPDLAAGATPASGEPAEGRESEPREESP
jgi:outer membrane protein TolC